MIDTNKIPNENGTTNKDEISLAPEQIQIVKKELEKKRKDSERTMRNRRTKADKYQEYDRNWNRLHRLNSTHKSWVGKKNITKRPHPESNTCEVCYQPEKGKRSVLQYHHWKDEDPSKGVWVCTRCHWLCEVVDLWSTEKRASLADTYLQLRITIEGNENV